MEMGLFSGRYGGIWAFSVQEAPRKGCVTIVNGDTVARRARKWP